MDSEPDPRFTLANERTFLSWIRTSLALIAGGVVLAQLGDHFKGPAPGRALAALPILAGVALSVFAFVHWRKVQRALRTGEPLPPPAFAPVLTGLVVVVGLALAAYIAFG
ncbi:hypothetical protein DPM19_04130 [Actinomadura craniellae]|uniref:DUF202 domain-containing protein n=1 Tax=Actinomadura craniellae TaxID=2231787 RepID=A0A365HE80_9ACTN|nr:DUF202 domain-containing protein [Actinomadura craniellae]RAY16553.1 hypothetical protein DPM19_04130 [Actinomadura craniellae]